MGAFVGALFTRNTNKTNNKNTLIVDMIPSPPLFRRTRLWRNGGFSLSGVRTPHRTAFDYSASRFLGGISPISASTQDLAANTRLRCPGKATLMSQKTRKIARETGQASTKNRVSHNRWAQNSSVSTIANTPKGRYRISLR